MSLPSSLRNVRITDNTIGIGYSSNTSSITTHTYTGCVSLAADALVSGNTIAGCIGGSSGATNLVTISSSSCLIKNNLFIRGAGSPVGSYISFSGTNESTLSGNVFDQPTVDGSSTALITNLPAASICNENKNQTATVEVSLSDRALFYSNGSTSQATINGTYSNGTVVDLFLDDSPSVSDADSPRSDILNIEDTASGTNRVYLKRFNLSSLVPRGAKIVGVQGGAVLNSALSLSSGFWGIRLISYKKIASQSISGTLLDANDFLFNTAAHVQYDSYVSKDLLTLTSSVSAYLSLDTTSYLSSDVSENYRIGADYNTILEWKVSYTKTGTTVLAFSPMVVLFRW